MSVSVCVRDVQEYTRITPLALAPRALGDYGQVMVRLSIRLSPHFYGSLSKQQLAKTCSTRRALRRGRRDATHLVEA
jgi:hypothetical protein